jgi:hypothetical protein
MMGAFSRYALAFAACAALAGPARADTDDDVVEAKPKPSEDSAYSRFMMYIDKEHFTPCARSTGTRAACR